MLTFPLLEFSSSSIISSSSSAPIIVLICSEFSGFYLGRSSASASSSSTSPSASASTSSAFSGTISGTGAASVFLGLRPLFFFSVTGGGWTSSLSSLMFKEMEFYLLTSKGFSLVTWNCTFSYWFPSASFFLANGVGFLTGAATTSGFFSTYLIGLVSFLTGSAGATSNKKDKTHESTYVYFFISASPSSGCR